MNLQSLFTEGQPVNPADSATTYWRGADLPRGYVDITDKIDLSGCDLLNADTSAGGHLRALFDSADPKSLSLSEEDAAALESKDWVTSGADDQLLLFMPFHSILKLHTIQVRLTPFAFTLLLSLLRSG